MAFLLALLLLAAPAPTEPPCTGTPAFDLGAPTQPSGPGLWIGGRAFASADIAGADQQWDPMTGVPMVIVTFTETGKAKFIAVQQGRVGDILEIAIDGILVSAPYLREPIAGGEVMISGSFDEAEAASLAARLRGLPACRR